MSLSWYRLIYIFYEPPDTCPTSVRWFLLYLLYQVPEMKKIMMMIMMKMMMMMMMMMMMILSVCLSFFLCVNNFWLERLLQIITDHSTSLQIITDHNRLLQIITDHYAQYTWRLCSCQHSHSTLRNNGFRMQDVNTYHRTPHANSFAYHIVQFGMKAIYAPM